jgi:hypothetical protein
MATRTTASWVNTTATRPSSRPANSSSRVPATRAFRSARVSRPNTSRGLRSIVPGSSSPAADRPSCRRYAPYSGVPYPPLGTRYRAHHLPEERGPLGPSPHRTARPNATTEQRASAGHDPRRSAFACWRNDASCAAEPRSCLPAWRRCRPRERLLQLCPRLSSDHAFHGKGDAQLRSAAASPGSSANRHATVRWWVGCLAGVQRGA